MTLRKKLRALLKESYDAEGYGIEIEVGPQWTVGRDIPTTWEKSELKQLHKECLLDNLHRGVIDKPTFRRMLHGEK